MKYLVICAALLTGPTAGLAQTAGDKAQSCGYQGDVVAAVQEKRRKRVSERKVAEAILAQRNPWPEKFDNAVPLVVPWVYDLPRKQLKQDLRAVWMELCLAQ